MDKKNVAMREVQFQDVCSILQHLKEMEEMGEKRSVVSGEFEGPFFSSAVYSCKIRIGFDDESR